MNTKNYIFGLHSVSALLQRQPERIIRLCIHQERNDKKMDALLRLAKEQGLSVETVSKQELDRLTQEANHQGVVAFCDKAHVYTEHDLPNLLQQIKGIPFILILDGVQDPHNLGACFRTADAA